MTIAALYVDPRGPYIDMVGVDAWTIDRDARLYDGPSSVVAHPPCADWCLLSHMHPTRPERAACGPRAVDQVRQFGGVLEHPAFSKLWHECDMPRPGEFTDEFGGWTLSVDQVRFRARWPQEKGRAQADPAQLRRVARGHRPSGPG